jgi:hypothetical protein
MTLAYQRFTAVLLLIYGSRFLSGVWRHRTLRLDQPVQFNNVFWTTHAIDSRLEMAVNYERRRTWKLLSQQMDTETEENHVEFRLDG